MYVCLCLYPVSRPRTGATHIYTVFCIRLHMNVCMYVHNYIWYIYSSDGFMFFQTPIYLKLF